MYFKGLKLNLKTLNTTYEVFNNASDLSFKAVPDCQQNTTDRYCMMNSIVSNISPFDSVQIFKNNVIKTESTRTLSITWTKLCTKIIFILLQTSVLLFQIYYQKKSFLTTSNIENKFCSSTEFQ